MPLPGQTFLEVGGSLAALRNAGQSIRDQLQRAGPGVVVPSSVELQPIGVDALNRTSQAAMRDVTWSVDGLCTYRGVVIASQVADAAGQPLVGSLGAEHARVAAAVAYLPGPIHINGSTNPFWDLHAATVAQPSGSQTPMVVDGSFFRAPVPIGEWAMRVGGPVDDVLMHHPWRLAGVQEDGGTQLITMADQLLNASTELANYGHRVGGDLSNAVFTRPEVA